MPKLTNITKKFGIRSVFDGFCAEFPKNVTSAVLGKSGVGKTTLLNVIANLTDYQGVIEGFGAISYVFQEPRLLEHLTVYENLDCAIRSSVPDASDREKAIDEVLRSVKLTHLKNRLAGRLSGGEKQRVSIARAFAKPSDTVLLDEAFNSLDLSLKFDIMQDYIALNRKYSRTGIFVTHDVDDALFVADEIFVLEENALVSFGRTCRSQNDGYGYESDNSLRKRLYDYLLKGIIE